MSDYATDLGVTVIPKGEMGFPLAEAIMKATSCKVHPSTAYRWCQKPNQYGIRLESWLQGGRRVTSVEAVRRYNERNTLASDM